jgi:uncharacterized protein (DUF1015 family)
MKAGIKNAKILLPKTDDMSAWACIACDQFTSQIDYWQNLEKTVAGKPTTLDLFYPEIYLNDNPDKRIAKINENMKRYLTEGLIKELPEGMILTVRSTPFVERRIGIVCAIDLEEYQYSQKSDALIRSTEGTIEERIPPRLKIRKDAEIEFPHVMILFDDEKREIAETLYENRDSLKKVYDFDLNMGGGHIEGYFIEKTDDLIEKISHLIDSERVIKKYGKDDKFLFAVGDGNHSLATAKAHWNAIKENLTEEERKNHPARFALAELVNIYDEGIYFRPIYRYVFGVDVDKFLNGLKQVDGGKIRVHANKTTVKVDGKNALPEGIRAIDAYIKKYLDEFGGEVDYVHGDDDLKNLVDAKCDAVGIMFEEMDKKDLFKYVSTTGALPRKTFSMGEGIEKRYYLEGRRIK